MLGSSLLPGFGVDQSYKVVDLLKHYKEHQQTEPELGFLDFIVMHYGVNSEHHKHPNHSHHNLPTVGHAVPTFTSFATQFFTLAASVILLLRRKARFNYANLYSFVSVTSLINPPRA
ncbi:hypothetical protein GCM10028807_41670 [Spirosoma daeguense]